MAISYDPAGNVVGTVDYAVAFVNDEAVGLHDFAAHEEQGSEFWHSLKVNGAHGHGTWPEFLGAAAHDFRVELEGKRIARLVHHKSGHVRERSAIEAAIGQRTVDGVTDLRGLTGGPTRALELDANGRTRQG